MSEPAAHAGDTFLERRFRFAANGTTLARDTMGGVTTFIVMSYIIFVNPQILSFAGIADLQDIGLPFEQVLAATCLVAGVMTILMGLYTNRAYALAPGLGLNAVVAFSLVAGEGLSFPAAMGLIVVEGIAVTILVVTGMREKIMDCDPARPEEGDRNRNRPVHCVHRPRQLGRRRRGKAPVVDLARLYDVADLRHVLRPDPDDRAARARRPWRPLDRHRRDDDPRHDHQRGRRGTTQASPPARAGRVTSTRRRTCRCSGTSTSTPSPSSRSSPPSSGRSRSSWPTSSTRWARSSASASRRAISTRKGGCRRFASRCSSTRSPRSREEPHRPRPRRPTSSPRPGSPSEGGPAGWRSSAARSSSRSCSSRRSSAWCRHRRRRRR